MGHRGGKGEAGGRKSAGLPEGVAARQLALDLLQGVWTDRMTFAEMEAHPHFLEAAPDLRARAGRLARTTLRLSGRADAALKPLLHKPPRPAIRAVLRLAAVEIFAEGEAPHGVVNAAVALARRQHAGSAGLVNAVLRRLVEAGRDRWDAAQPQRLPGWLRGRLGATYGNARVARMEAAFEAVPPLDLTMKGPDLPRPEAELLPTGSLRLPARGQVSALPGFDAGAWWVQDAAAALPARLLAARPGERVLDLCAAPGGKTLQLAAAGAEVTALDSSEPRLDRLRENLARCQLSAEIVCADGLDWQPDRGFDAILLDAPCSATGTIRRHPDLPFVKDAATIKPLFALQAGLSDRAAALLAPGGRIVFCTCSLLPEEGEAQLAGLLDRMPDLREDPEAIDALAGLEPDWRVGPGSLRTTPDMWPERGGLDGFFIAALRKA